MNILRTLLGPGSEETRLLAQLAASERRAELAVESLKEYKKEYNNLRHEVRVVQDRLKKVLLTH